MPAAGCLLQEGRALWEIACFFLAEKDFLENFDGGGGGGGKYPVSFP